MESLPPPSENRGPLMLQVTWIAVGIASIFLAARIFTRIKTLGKLKLDDYLILLALVDHLQTRHVTCSLANSTIGFWHCFSRTCARIRQVGVWETYFLPEPRTNFASNQVWIHSAAFCSTGFGFWKNLVRRLPNLSHWHQ